MLKNTLRSQQQINAAVKSRKNNLQHVPIGALRRTYNGSGSNPRAFNNTPPQNNSTQ
jgi:hypothetical protein